MNLLQISLNFPAQFIHTGLFERNSQKMVGQCIPWQKLTFTGRLILSEDILPTGCFFWAKCGLFMCLDICLFFLCTVSSYRIIAWTLFTPAERGFYCNDPGISAEYRKSTVPTLILLVVTVAIPFFSIVIANLLAKLKRRFRDHMADLFNHSIHVYFDYAFAFWLTILSLDIIKCFVGRTRPNFLATCIPRELVEICANDPYAFVPIAHCTIGSWKMARNSKLSFPSGHAALSTFCALYHFFYLRGIQRRHPNRICMKPFFYAVSAIFALFAILCCCSRVYDGWHHPSDVLAGIMLGSLMFHLLLSKYYRTIPSQRYRSPKSPT